MEVRDFSVADQVATRALIQAGLRERWGPTFDPDANPDTDDLWASYVATGGEVVVAVSQAQVVGTGTLIELASDCGQLVRMATAEGHRRKGIAREVVAELVRRAQARGFKRLVVTTDTPWRSAVALYQSCGFQIEAVDSDITRFGMWIDGDRHPSGDVSTG